MPSRFYFPDSGHLPSSSRIAPADTFVRSKVSNVPNWHSRFPPIRVPYNRTTPSAANLLQRRTAPVTLVPSAIIAPHFQRRLPPLDSGTCRRRILSFLRCARCEVALYL